MAGARHFTRAGPLSWNDVRLRVLTYNIHRAIGVDRRFRPERIARIVAAHDADLVLLQEVDVGVPRSREMDLARDLAQALGFPHLAAGYNVALRRGRYGNATLSRHPILRERNIDLTVGSRKRRGCQHTTVALQATGGMRRRIEVFNLHLGLSAVERELQIGALIRSAEFAGLGADAPCLVGGDFNDWRRRLEPIFTVALGFGTPTEPRWGRQRAVATFPAFFPRGPLDRIYFRGRLRLLSARRCRLRISRVASDHLPLIADFELH
jgi:endonuclease/exonuclease/phosphatase family metal-dependent hydrolase